MSTENMSRRQFLKLAGVTGATIGLGAGLGGLAAACGEETAETTTTAAQTTTTTAQTTTTAAQTTTSGAATTTSAGPEAGREVKIGIVAPATGALAAFSSAVNWSVERVNEFAKDGLVAGDGKNHPLKLITLDTQSDSSRAAQVTGDLIQNYKVDMIISAGSPETVNPSADQCEALGMPSLSCNVPWQAFHFGRGGTPESSFKWTYAMALGLEQIVGGYIDMWATLQTNKVVGALWPNTADGQSWSNEETGAPPMLKAAGYSLVFPGLYPPGAEDYTAQISDYKKAGCEIVTGATSAPDFTNFWTQAVQRGLRPKAMTIGLALLFPESAEAVGDIVVGCTSELLWHPSWSFKSSLTGETCQQLADDYEARSGQQWSPAIPQYARLEWAIDVLKRTKNLDDKEEIIANVASTNMQTCWGPVDFTAPVQMGTDHPTPNVVRTPTAGGQWVKGTKHRFEIIPVSNKFAPGTEVVGTVQPITYPS
ncbi:MAG: ABC transporter substrate-binding protein [Actinomycetia bacterium]|nr:ABC transporter substrate-binding protein [Actinomycetes bacterium]